MILLPLPVQDPDTVKVQGYCLNEMGLDSELHCSLCSANFRRLEHLQRHLASRTDPLSPPQSKAI